MATKIEVATREEALALIAGGTNSMLVFSPEAPYGYKKDGTPAGRRGRHALANEVKEARAAAKAASGRTRAKTGPVVRTPEAPFGVKKDGTPMAKRGRPSKEDAEARKAAKEAARAEKRAAREARKAAKAAAAAAPVAPVAEETAAPAEPLAPVGDAAQESVSEAITG